MADSLHKQNEERKEEEQVQNSNLSGSNEENNQKVEDINAFYNSSTQNTGNNNKSENLPQQKDQSNAQNINIDQNMYLNPEYYDEFGRPKYEDVVAYENQLRAEIELNSPLVSDKLDIVYLVAEFKDSQFEKSVEEIISKYKYIRTVRRDGNCFYRSYLFRLFEELASKKESKLYNQVLKTVEDSKNLCERNNYQWLVFEDFYNTFISEWKFVYQLDPMNTSEYM